MSREHKKILYNSKLHKIFSYFSFYNYWMSLNLYFWFFFPVLIGIMSSTIELKICLVAAFIKKYKSVIKKKKNKHDKVVFSATSKLNLIEVLISKTLVD